MNLTNTARSSSVCSYFVIAPGLAERMEAKDLVSIFKIFKNVFQRATQEGREREAAELRNSEMMVPSV